MTSANPTASRDNQSGAALLLLLKARTFIALIIEGHSEVVGATKEPQRVLFNFLVEDVVSEQARLEAAGVDFVVPLHEEPGFGLISTFVDPAGNYGQLLEMRG